MEIREKIIQTIKKVTGANEVHLEVPEREEFGDYTSNIAMQLAGAEGKVKSSKIASNLAIEQFYNPRDLAVALVEKFQNDSELMKVIESIEIAGPGFINFYLTKEALLSSLDLVLKEKDQFGSSEEGGGRTVVIDYSAPNIAKRFSIGHLRSTIIGQALYNLYKFQGYKVVGDNHIGDWGTQFGTLLYQITSKGLKAKDLTIEELETLYVEFHQKKENDPALSEEARKWFKKLEDGDKKARGIWEVLIATSFNEFNRIYDMLKVKIDYVYGESFYETMMPEVVKEAKGKGLSKESEGAIVIETPGTDVPLILVKRDGATTYATRDLATLKFRKEKWSPSIIIYEVGVEQTLHFQQVFAAAKLLGYVQNETELVHTKHGWYLGEDGKKFSTRKGKTVKLDDILEEAIERAKKLSDGNDSLAKKVGVGAIKYFDLSHNVQSDIVFDWEKMFVMQGNSGPYLQYTYARTQSVLEKMQSAKGKAHRIDGHSDERGDESQSKKHLPRPLTDIVDNFTLNKEERSVLRHLSQFPEVIEAAAKSYSPNLLCNYLYLLCQKYNSFYNEHRILDPEESVLKTEITQENESSDSKDRGPDTTNFRLALTYATGQVLKNGLTLLGIEAPERM